MRSIEKDKMMKKTIIIIALIIGLVLSATVNILAVINKQDVETVSKPFLSIRRMCEENKGWFESKSYTVMHVSTCSVALKESSAGAEGLFECVDGDWLISGDVEWTKLP